MSQDVQSLYEQQYVSNRNRDTLGAKLSWWAESWMHREVSRDVRASAAAMKVLEIGAGNLNHLAFEPRVLHYEVVEPFVALFESSKAKVKVTAHYLDISQLPASASFDRIVSIAAFEHLLNLPWTIARCGLALNKAGNVRIAVPTEGGLLWWLGWRLTTGLEFALRYKLDYGEIMRHEHVSTVMDIETLLRYFFKIVSVKRLGLGVHGSLYTFFSCHHPDLERCGQHIRRHPDGLE